MLTFRKLKVPASISIFTRQLVLFSILLATSAGKGGTLPVRVGACSNTTIKSIGTRVEGMRDSGSMVTFTNGGQQVGYETVPAINESKAGDPVRMCLLSIPKNCPAGDNRGRVYRTTNLRTHKTWELADSSHVCGGS